MPRAMNQYLDLQHFTLTPDLSPGSLDTTLTRLLVHGRISDGNLERYCRQLDERFRTFAATCPEPTWAPGLLITAEIRRQYEIYLPVIEIKAAFAAFCRLSSRYEPVTETASISNALSWPDMLARLQLWPVTVNPASILRRLATSERVRFAFHAALFIPKSFGGSFSRYPLQTEFLRKWLAGQKKRLQGSIALLDAACGSGEGTYEAAAAVLDCGYAESLSLVEGTTLEPLELAAAAHGWFPQDKARSLAFRQSVSALCAGNGVRIIRFRQEDLFNPLMTQKKYDVIICNGLLGGPLLYRQDKLAMVIAMVVERLKPGGIFLAANCFHEGWLQLTPPATIVTMLTESGLHVVAVGEGIGAAKSG